MTDPLLEDHVVGLELELVELVEQEHRAEAQGRVSDALRLEGQIAALQLELADSAERLAAAEAPPSRGAASADVHAPSAQELSSPDPKV